MDAGHGKDDINGEQCFQEKTERLHADVEGDPFHPQKCSPGTEIDP
jgi:hypothetical protein